VNTNPTALHSPLTDLDVFLDYWYGPVAALVKTSAFGYVSGRVLVYVDSPGVVQDVCGAIHCVLVSVHDESRVTPFGRSRVVGTIFIGRVSTEKAPEKAADASTLAVMVMTGKPGVTGCCVQSELIGGSQLNLIGVETVTKEFLPRALRRLAVRENGCDRMCPGLVVH